MVAVLAHIFKSSYYCKAHKVQEKKKENPFATDIELNA
jgi:hypothetical protein